jgi:hypothetical protein
MKGEEDQMLNKIAILESDIVTTVVAALAAPQTPNLTRNPNPTKKTKKKNQKETLGGMPVHTQKWQPFTMASLLSFYSTRREGVCSVPSTRSHRPTYPHH